MGPTRRGDSNALMRGSIIPIPAVCNSSRGVAVSPLLLAKIRLEIELLVPTMLLRKRVIIPRRCMGDGESGLSGGMGGD